MIRSTSTLRTRYAETDKMGFVHHQHYVQYFELARVDLLKTIGLCYRTMEENGIFMPVLSVQVQYHHPNTFDDELVVHCALDTLVRARVQIHYEVFRRDLKTTSGSSQHSFMNAQGRPIKPPSFMLEAIRAHPSSAHTHPSDHG